MTYKAQHQQKFEGHAQPKWRRAPLPEDVLNRTISSAAFTIHNKETQIDMHPLNPDGNPFIEDQLRGSEENFRNHLGDVFINHTSAKSKNGFHITSSRLSDHLNPIQVTYDLGQSPVMAERNLIHAKAGHSMSVVLRYTSSDKKARHHGVTSVIAEAGSQLDIIRFQNLSADSEFFDNIHFQVEEGARVRFFDYQIGSAFKALGCQADLKGRHSQFEVYNGYLGFGSDLLDLSYMAQHFGAHSESKILAKGALGDKARKTFRGTLDFKAGSKTAVGQEEEFVLILSPDVNSDSIPALMCEEDDVIGEHAASIGRMDTDLLFYMMSRGYSEDEARRTLVTAAVAETLEGLEIQDLREEILSAFEERLTDNKEALVPVRS